MRIAKQNSWMMLCAVVLLLAGQAAWAQTANVPARVVDVVDETQTVTLKGNVHPLARAEFDQGAVSDAAPATRMMLLLQRSPEQETALRQLLDQQQDKTSANYHGWLTPEQFGNQFGPADGDVQAVTDWLQSHGFQNVKVGAGRTTVEFSGNVGQVRNAFHTDIHQFLVHGEQHMANVSDPQIPAALAPVLGGVLGLHNFRPKPLVHRMTNFQPAKAKVAGTKPSVTFISGCGPSGTEACYGVAPGDFATIYNTKPLVSGSPKIDGTGVTIAIVQDSNVYVTDIQQFNGVFGLSTNFGPSNIILNGPDPGVQSTASGNGDEGEAVLDVEWSGAVAPGATIDLVVSQTSATIGAGGTDLSANYIVQNNLAPIMSESFGLCEAELNLNGNNGVTIYNLLWEQAAAQGITVILATGDNGSDMCDAGNGDYGTQGLGISGLASTPFNVAVGGTDFQSAGLAGYWNAPGVGVTESAKSYIPEQTWNSGCAAAAVTGSLNSCATLSSSANGIDMLAGGGGQSAYPSVNAKPAWQTGVVPSADTGRDIPDLALFSAVNSSSNDFYLTCEQDSQSQGGNPCSLTSNPVAISPVGGTSAAAPAFAGIMALIIQMEGGVRQGNANYVLYQLYKTNTAGTICPSNTASVTAKGCIFYDTVTGNNSVACQGKSSNCSNQSSTSQYGVLVDPKASTTPAFLAVTGYDKGTGLGSVNVANLAKAWGTASFDKTSALISAASPSSITHGQTVSFTVTVTSTSGTPTGYVSLIATPNGGGTPVGIGAFTDSNVLPPSPNFELVNGTATITTNLLPGGTDSVVAEYGGDGTFAPAKSAAVDVTVTPESSVTTVTLWGYDSADGLYDISIAASSTVVYGTTPYIMRVDVTNAAKQQCSAAATTLAIPCPTGTIMETYNNGLPLNDFPNAQTGISTNQATLNSLGFLEDLPINLPGGNDTIVAAYSGDTSYSGSTSTPAFPITVTPASTAASVSSSASSVTTGASVTLTALVATQSTSTTGPTGTVTFYNGSTAIGTAVQVTSNGSGQGFYAGATATLNTSFSTTGTKTITAQYNGDTNYTASAVSAAITITVTQGTGSGSFAMSGSAVTVTAGSGGTSTITLVPTGGFTGSVGITCGTAVPGVTCGALNVTVPSGGGNGTGSLTVNVAAPSSSMTAMNLPETQNFRAALFPSAPNARSGWWTLSGGTGFAAIFLLFVPGRKRYRTALGLALMCVLSFTMGCGGGGGTITGGMTPTVTHLTVSATKVAANASITVSATVTGGTPNGNVQFLVDGAALGGAVPVTGGTTGNITVTAAQAPAFLQLVGTHAVSASYLGGTTTSASTSGTLKVTVTGTTQLPITANPGSSNASPAISLTIN